MARGPDCDSRTAVAGRPRHRRRRLLRVGVQRLSAALGPTIGLPPESAIVPAPAVELTDPAILYRLAALADIIIPGAVALALIAAIDAMLCARLAGAPGERHADSNRMLVRSAWPTLSPRPPAA